MQEPQLHYDKEQEDDDRSARVQKILSPLPQAHWPQGNEVKTLSIANCRLPI